MIIVRISGGLGNQLFQYGFARAIAERTAQEVYIDTSSFHPLLHGKSTLREYMLSHFSTTLPETNTFQNIFRKLATSVFKSMKVIRKTDPFVFDKEVFTQTNGVYFVGIWANYRYLTEVQPILLKEFALKESMSDQGKEILKQEEVSTSVSVHIRRGDYLQHQHKFVVLTEAYYAEAVRIIRERTQHPRFFIFSDDIAYVKETYKGLFGDDAVYVSDMRVPDVEELILMSRCKHNIVANSTFSLWAAWLNQNQNPIVIAPKKYKLDDTDGSNFISPELGWLQI